MKHTHKTFKIIICFLKWKSRSITFATRVCPQAYMARWVSDRGLWKHFDKNRRVVWQGAWCKLIFSTEKSKWSRWKTEQGEHGPPKLIIQVSASQSCVKNCTQMCHLGISLGGLESYHLHSRQHLQSRLILVFYNLTVPVVNIRLFYATKHLTGFVFLNMHHRSQCFL